MINNNEEICTFDHETTLDPEHWFEFFAWEKKELKRDQKLPKYLLGGLLASLSIAGFIRQDSAMIFACVTGGILLAIVYFTAIRINTYFRRRISQENPVVKFNSTGYQLGQSFRSWPFGVANIIAVIINEHSNYNVLEIHLSGRRLGYHNIRIPFNKQDEDIILYYKDYISKRM